MATATVFDPEPVRAVVAAAVLGPGFRRATFGGVRRGVPTPWRRVEIRPVSVRGAAVLQFSYYDGRKHVAKNYPPADAGPPLAEVIALGFGGVHVWTAAGEIDVRVSKKGKVLVGRRKAGADIPAGPEPHNRAKDLPLPEGRADRLLEVMGVLTPDGRVRPAMRGKFAQINEFLKHLRHALDAAGVRDLGRPVELLDAGCGASFLTLAAHHYLNEVLGVPARVLGVDVNDEVVRKSLDRADRLGAGGAEFRCRPIAGAVAAADIVIALHACDTATDDALAAGVAAGARVILAAPCCHHDLNSRLKPAGPAAALAAVLRHGILRERQADLLTDAFRAAALRVIGYRTEVVEFVGPDHTARNLLIRAVAGGPAADPAAAAEYNELKRFAGQTPYIEGALGEGLTRLL